MFFLSYLVCLFYLEYPDWVAWSTSSLLEI